LAKLLTTLSGNPIGGRLKEPSKGRKLQRFERLGNLSTSFDFMKRVGVKISNIGPEDVATGNQKLTQGLIWTLINFFLVDSEPDDVPLSEGGKKLTPKQRMLEWVKVIVNSYPGVNVQSWKTGFQDGLALCALVHFHAPKELDFYALDPKDNKGNLLHVFELLSSRWGIPKLVDPLHLLAGRVDEEMLVALVATCKKELKNIPEVLSPPVSARSVLPDEEAQWESRKLLKTVVDCAKEGDRPGVDDAMVVVLKRFRNLLQDTDDLASTLTAKRQADIHGVRQRLDRALRDLMTDAVLLCQHPESAVHRRLVRRDVMALCAAEGELLRLCADGTDSSKKQLIDRMRTLRVNKEPTRIMEASKLAEAENNRLAEATKAKVQAREAQMEPAHSKAAHLMIAELECMSPRFAPLAVKLAEDPSNKETQRELAELNRDITGIMADLELTLQLDASKELQALQQAIQNALDLVRAQNPSWEACQKSASNVGSRCQTALSAARASCDSMPRETSKPILKSADVLDEELTLLQYCSGTGSGASDIEPSLAKMQKAADDLYRKVASGEEEFRRDSAVPEVRDAVSAVLGGVRGGDVDAVAQGSKKVDEGSQRAIALAKARLAENSNDEASRQMMENFVSDLEILAPLHQEAAQKAKENPADRKALRRVAETARDVLSVVSELNNVANTPVVEDEFSSLQSLLGMGGGDDVELGLVLGEIEMFDVVSDSRDVADAARQAVAENPYAEDATDILATIQELEMAIPAVMNGDENAASKIGSSLPALETKVKERDEKRNQDRLDAPEDDLVRLSRYARAGADEKDMVKVQEEASSKSKKWVAKQKVRAEDVADPIRQQRIMEAVADLEAMAPLQMEAFSSFLEEPELLVAVDEFEELSAGLALASNDLDGLFPDLLLATPIDLDNAIFSLEQGAHEVNAPPLALRELDLETLAPRGPPTARTLAPEMLQLDVIDTPEIGRKKSLKFFDAEPHAQRVVESLAEGGDEDDEEILEGAELAEALDEMIAMLAKLGSNVGEIPKNFKNVELAVSVVDQACEIIGRGKGIAMSLTCIHEDDAEVENDGDDEDDESSLMYARLEDLANRSAEMVFAVQECFDDDPDMENLAVACNALQSQGKLVEQLAVSQALLLSVDKFELPTAESALAEAHGKLDSAWHDDLEESKTQPDLDLINQMKDQTKLATSEWSWDPFLEVVVDGLERTHCTVPRIQDSGKRVLMKQAGEALLGRAKQILWTSVHKPEEISAAVSSMLDALDALVAACQLLDAKAFQPVRTIDSSKDAVRIHNALMEGVSISPKAGELLNRLSLVEEKLPPLSTELRTFKSAPQSFVPGTFIGFTVELLVDSGVVCRGLMDDATKTLLQSLREQLSETAIAFLFCALDIVEYPEVDSVDESLVALKKLSLALLQLGKWARKASVLLQPAHSVASDPDCSRIMRQLKGLKLDEFSGSSSNVEIGTVRGLVMGVSDAIQSAEDAVQLVPEEIDPSGVSDAVVHVILGVTSLAKYFGQDVHVQQLVGMTEQLANVSFEVIFRVKDLNSNIGNALPVDASVDEMLIMTNRMRANSEALSGKLGKIGELRSLAEALDSCQQLLGEPLPTPPRVSSLRDFERVVKAETVSVNQYCKRVDKSFDISGFVSGLVSCAGVVRNNATIVPDNAGIVKVTTSMVKAGRNSLRNLEVAASADPNSEVFQGANARLKDEVGDVALMTMNLEEMVEALCRSSSSNNSGGNSKSGSNSNSKSNSPKGGSPSNLSPAGSPGVSRHRQTVIVGKSLSNSINDLSLRKTALFSSSDEMPRNLAHSLELLEPTERKINRLLREERPGPNIQRAVLYYLNLLKHLASGYLKTNNDKLNELVKLLKNWAGQVVLVMKGMESDGKFVVHNSKEFLQEVHVYLTTQVVLCCSVCSKAISGGYTTADGVSFHNSCFNCCTCGQPIQGQYYREKDKIYCVNDIPMTNSMVCKRCGETIELGTNYLECRNSTYHRECFSCIECDVPLSTHFYVNDFEEIVCENHA
jgi:hypothetical protein